MSQEQPKPYAIDTLIATVKAISDTPLVFFQRDGSFYATSPQGYGKISYNLSLVPQNPRNEEWRQELPEIIDSENVIMKKCEDRDRHANEKTEFKKGEKPYISALIFNRDSYGVVNLETMAATARSLGALPDDDNIRLLSHNRSYHSHKYGYGCDGADTWIGDARVMNRDRYFELMREKEDDFFEKLHQGDESVIEKAYRNSAVGFMNGRPLEIPDVMVITPNVMVTFPRLGELDHHEPNKVWTREMDLHEWPVYRGVHMSERSPFGIYCVVNKKLIEAKTLNGLDVGITQVMTYLSDDLAGVKKAMPHIESFLDRINYAHNQANNKRIEHIENYRAKRIVNVS